MATRTVRTIEPEITVVEITGRLNVGKNLSEVEDELRGLVGTGVRKLVLDLSKLDYIDSASIGMLIGVRNEVVEAGGAMRLAGAHGLTKRTFEVIRLDAMIPLDADLNAAVAALSR